MHPTGRVCGLVLGRPPFTLSVGPVWAGPRSNSLGLWAGPRSAEDAARRQGRSIEGGRMPLPRCHGVSRFKTHCNVSQNTNTLHSNTDWYDPVAYVSRCQSVGEKAAQSVTSSDRLGHRRPYL